MTLKTSFQVFSVLNFYLLGILLLNIFTPITANAASLSGEATQDTPYNLMLIGGQLEICSNTSLRFCDSDYAKNVNQTRYLQTYELSGSTLTLVTQTDGYQTLKPEIKSRLDKLLDYFYNNPQKVNSIDSLGSLMQAAPLGFDAREFFNNIPNDVYYSILDYAHHKTYPDLKVELEKSNSIAAKEIMATFIKHAQLKRKPDEVLTLRFLTSSQRNPFERVSWLQQVLQQTAQTLAIEKVNIGWIPMDQSLIQALEINNMGGDGCSALESLRNKNNLYNVSVRYPELHNLQQNLCQNPEELENVFSDAHGIFISDAHVLEDKHTLGNMRLFRTMQGQDTIYKEIIQRRFNNNEVFIAGNGDGARILSGGIFANRPVPIITGGTGTASLVRGAFALPPVPTGCEKQQNCPFGMIEDDLTYESMGGLGLFNYGIVDTHFSVQNRHARMATLAVASKTRFSFGIDTNTAVLVAEQMNPSTNETTTRIRVIGDQGVYIIDMRDGIVKTQSSKHQIIGLSHNLNHGDVLTIDNNTMELTFSFSESSLPLSKKGLVIPMNDGVYHRNVSFNCGTTTFHRWNEDNIAWLINPGEDTHFFINRNQWGETCSYNNLLFGVEN